MSERDEIPAWSLALAVELSELLGYETPRFQDDGTLATSTCVAVLGAYAHTVGFVLGAIEHNPGGKTQEQIDAQSEFVSMYLSGPALRHILHHYGHDVEKLGERVHWAICQALLAWIDHNEKVPGMVPC